MKDEKAVMSGWFGTRCSATAVSLSLFAGLVVADTGKLVLTGGLKEQLTDQLCQLSGGPCKYEGDTMKASHASLGVTRADFNTLVEVLQFAMDAKGIPFRDQNRMLALLAPIHRDIITK